MAFDVPWPEGLTRTALMRCPAHLRADAIQDAWLALAQGRKPDSAVRALLRHEDRHRAEKPDFELCRAGSVRRRF